MPANPLLELRGLTATAPPPTVALVIQHNADGTTTLEWPGGAQSRLRGASVSVGQWAYVQNGAIIGAAPEAAYYRVAL